MLPISPAAQQFLNLATELTQASSPDQFFTSLRAGHLGIHARVAKDPSGLQGRALQEAFEVAQADLAKRLALQMCAMPMYERPLLPVADQALPEFLWLFALPVILRFSSHQVAQGPLVWPEDALPGTELLEMIHAGQWLEPRARLGLFAPLYTRSDLLAWGPENMALHAVNAELFDTPGPHPLPLQLAAAHPAYRSVFCLGLGIARLPAGVTGLYQRSPDKQELSALEAKIAGHLQRLNIGVESVTVLAPCPVTSSCILANPAFLEQVAYNCEIAQTEFGAVSGQVRFPMAGYVEIVARTVSGYEINVLPPEPCSEPPAVVLNLLERVLRGTGLDVTAAAMPHVFGPTRLQ